MGGECPHHCATLARYLSLSNFLLSFSSVQVLPNFKLCILGNDVDTYRQTFQSANRGHRAFIKNQVYLWVQKREPFPYSNNATVSFCPEVLTLFSKYVSGSHNLFRTSYCKTRAVLPLPNASLLSNHNCLMYISTVNF